MKRNRPYSMLNPDVGSATEFITWATSHLGGPSGRHKRMTFATADDYIVDLWNNGHLTVIDANTREARRRLGRGDLKPPARWTYDELHTASQAWRDEVLRNLEERLRRLTEKQQR